MTPIIWSLVLTACADNGICYNQTIQWFDKKEQCIEFKILHEDIPSDGDWKTVKYKCGIVGATET
jgi:hypothetical protein